MRHEIPKTTRTAWYVVHTKPRQEARALENLQNQGFHCFLPMMHVEKLRQQRVKTVTEPMFSRYLFIELDDETQNWSPISSTLGVSRLVSFGPEPAKVPPDFIAFLKNAPAETLKRFFTPGDRVHVVNGPLKGVEGHYMAHDGETRAYVLVDLLGQPQKLRMAVESLHTI